MTRNQEIDLEIQRLASKLFPKCHALFELPMMIYSQILMDNFTRRAPYRVSEGRIKRIVQQMVEAGRLTITKQGG